VIVGGVSFEAAPPARQDYAETASIIVDGRKGLNEHSHRGAPAVALSSAHPAIGRVACPLIGQPGGTSLWCLGFVLGGKVVCTASNVTLTSRSNPRAPEPSYVLRASGDVLQRLLDAIEKERRKAAAAELTKAGSVPAGAPGRAADDASQG
jgi:hypothetical protein